MQLIIISSVLCKYEIYAHSVSVLIDGEYKSHFLWSIFIWEMPVISDPPISSHQSMWNTMKLLQHFTLHWRLLKHLCVIIAMVSYLPFKNFDDKIWNKTMNTVHFFTREGGWVSGVLRTHNLANRGMLRIWVSKSN